VTLSFVSLDRLQPEGEVELNVMTNQSTIDAVPMDAVAEGVVPTPATEALRIFMAQHVHDHTIGAEAATSSQPHLRMNAMEQSCQRQLSHRSAPAPPLPTSDPLDMSDLTRATAQVERRARRKKRSSSTASRSEDAADEFPAIEWNSDDEDDGDNGSGEGGDEDTYATNDDELGHQEQEGNENHLGTAASSSVEIEVFLKDGDSSNEGANQRSKSIAEEAHQASPNDKPPLRKRRSGDALGVQACADTLHRAKSRKMCLPGCLGPKDADFSSNEECGCLATSTRPATATSTSCTSTRQQKALLADSLKDTVTNQTTRQASSPFRASSSTSKSPSCVAQKPANSAFLAATLERVATFEDFINLAPPSPSRATSWGQFVSADNLSPLPSPPSHHYYSVLAKRKGRSPSRSHTGLELKKTGSYCNGITFQRGGKGSSSGAGSKRNNSFCPSYKGNKTTTTITTVGVPSHWSSLNTTASL